MVLAQVELMIFYRSFPKALAVIGCLLI